MRILWVVFWLALAAFWLLALPVFGIPFGLLCLGAAMLVLIPSQPRQTVARQRGRIEH
jgi:hypothetical protein